MSGTVDLTITTAASFTVATDGSCYPNPGGPGGWAAVIIGPDGSERCLSGGEPSTTNNRMELLAPIAALEELPAGSHVAVESDSEYLVKGMTRRVRSWARRDWQTSAGAKVKNADLWIRLVGAAARHESVEWRWVRGHDGHALNERADALAGEARKRTTPGAQAATIMVSFGDRTFPVRAWRGERLTSPFSFDTETAAFVDDDPSPCPEVVLASAFDGGTAYIVRREGLAKFLSVHADAEIVAHNASFDFWVVERWLREQGEAVALAALWELASSRLHDTAILDRLLRLADRRQAHTVGKPRSLAALANDVLDVELPKDEDVRTSFGSLVVDGTVDYAKLSPEKLAYAAKDSIATFQAFLILRDRAREVAGAHGVKLLAEAETRFGVLSETIHVRGQIALAAVTRRGLRVDPSRARALEDALVVERDRLGALLAKEQVALPRKNGGWKTSNAALTRCLRRVAQEAHDDAGRRVITSLPMNDRGTDVSRKTSDWEEWRAQHPFLECWLSFKATSTLLGTFVKALRSSDCIHARYNVLVRTGRTSSSKPNLQNLPREGGVREAFLPRPGHVFLVVDYKFIELVTLAQTQLLWFGSSRLAEVINSGSDPHRVTAAQLTGKKPDNVTKDERQNAKAANFGWPGGLGVPAFINYAKSTYGVTVTEDQAKTFKARWVETYPEMSRWLASDGLLDLARNLRLSREEVLGMFGAGTDTAGWIPIVVARVASGTACKKTGEPYSKWTVDRAWQLLRSGRLPAEHAWRANERAPSPLLGDYLRTVSALTITGRVRAGCSYTKARNTPFQGLAADGAKLALFDLAKAGYEAVAFVHDEVVLEIEQRADGDYTRVVEDVSRRMIAAMREVCPDVRVDVEPTVRSVWSKSDNEGLLWPKAKMT